MTRSVFLLAYLAVSAHLASGQITISWTNNLLTVSAPGLPGGTLDVWYLEAFCRRGANQRSWGETKIPHKTELLDASPRELHFRTLIATNVEMLHAVRASGDELDLTFDFHNKADSYVDIDWFQPACIRVERFSGRVQSNYTERAFVYTEKGLTRLSDTRRTEDALYRGGQVYVPAFIPTADANPRPVCKDRPVNGLIGCFSADGKYILATASDHTHELFEGVYVCLHSDPHVGGLRPGERKSFRSKIYFVKNEPDELLKRYRAEFGGKSYW